MQKVNRIMTASPYSVFLLPGPQPSTKQGISILVCEKSQTSQSGSRLSLLAGPYNTSLTGSNQGIQGRIRYTIWLGNRAMTSRGPGVKYW
jgi:hypothetical protein